MRTKPERTDAWGMMNQLRSIPDAIDGGSEKCLEQDDQEVAGEVLLFPDLAEPNAHAFEEHFLGY